MRRKIACLFIALMVTTSGCTTVQEILSGESSQTTISPPDSSSPSKTSSKTSTPSSTFFKPENTHVGEIVLRLSDLKNGYNITSDVNESVSTVSGERKSKFEQRGIIKQHRRLFTRERNVEEGPLYILSSVIVYKNETSSNQDLRSSLTKIRNQGGETTEVELESDLSVIQAEYEDAQGYNHTIIYRKVGNMVYFVTTTATQNHHENLSRKLLLIMANDVSDRGN